MEVVLSEKVHSAASQPVGRVPTKGHNMSVTGPAMTGDVQEKQTDGR